ncbi:MAG TPA: type II CAAX endopeptidase family protein [Capsulimonadaceae bacterium]|nr:type II CAAX endopeptidase family protein [Capsulimonadaceae bacterium]
MPTSTASAKASVTPTVLLGLLPWAAAWLGSYSLHSAVAAFLFYHLLCLTAWALYRRRYGRFPSQSVARARWIAMVLIAALIMGTTYFALGWLGWLVNPAHIRTALTSQRVGPTVLDYAALFAYFAVVNPIAEELFWRGTIYQQMRREGLNAPRAALVSALLFGSWHWLIVRLFFPAGWAIVITLGIVAAGAVFATVFERTRSIAFSIALHALAADIPILLALWFGVLAKA